MKKNILIVIILLCVLGFSQGNKAYRVYLRDGSTMDVINLVKVPNAINCESIDGMNSLSFSEKEYYSYRVLNTQIPFFEFKNKKFTDYVVVSIDSLSQKKLYDRTLNWIKEKYKNPDKVIKMTIDNEKIRIEGYKEDLYCYHFKVLGSENVNCYNGTYTIEISFKDGKYKFDPSYLEYHIPPIQDISSRDISLSLDDFSVYYDKNGILLKSYEYIPITIDDLFNTLNPELYDYILTAGKKDNW